MFPKSLQSEESKTRINNIIQDTDNKRTQNRLLDLQGNYQEIINSFQGQLSEKTIKKLSADIDYLNQDTERLILGNYITRENKENLLINSQLQNANLAMNIFKGKAQIKEIDANILVLKSTRDLNVAKTAGEKILNAINEVEKDNTVGSGMTKETGTIS